MKKNKKNYTKMILFFSFYLVFFTLLSIYLNHHQVRNEKEKNNEEIVTLITIKDLFNHDFNYNFEVNDNGMLQTFTGNKKINDYSNFDNKYFLDYININQLIKKGKVTAAGQLMTYYEIDNQTLNELLDTNILDGVNIMKEFYGNSQNNYEYSVTFDLTNYMGRFYTIILKYRVGDKSE